MSDERRAYPLIFLLLTSSMGVGASIERGDGYILWILIGVVFFTVYKINNILIEEGLVESGR